MQRYSRPQITAYGNVADLTKGKTVHGTDSMIGGQTQPGQVCIGPTASSDCVVPTP